MTQIVPVILSGGVGSRLWPTSRAHYPKQLLPLVSEKTMLQETALRVGDGALFAPPLIVSNDDHRFIIASQMQEAGIEPLAHILEPVGRNTAPAAAVAAHFAAEKKAPETVLLILPADHHIGDLAAFRRAVEEGARLAAEGSLVTFGIVPSAPETGYGYIRRGEELQRAGAYRVERFVEKPDAETAASYLADGGYYWNSGIFMFRADRILSEMEAFCPDIAAKAKAALAAAGRDLDFIRLDEAAFAASPSDSIDYAVMEHTSHAAVVPADMRWNDIGSWSALWEIGEKDAEGNVHLGDVIDTGSRNTYVRAETGLVATLGVEDLVIVASGDAVMVAARNKVQDVKKIVETLKAENRTEHEAHNRVYRPWGYYECLTNGNRHQVKHLHVYPGGALSLQLHHHRAEHWVVVSGRARVTLGEETSVLEANESTYIPVNTKHRLENPYDEPLSIIEVQSGSYLGEDDIVRFDDVYGRVDETKAAE